MATQREEITAIRDRVASAVEGNESAFQYLYGIGFGSLTKEQAQGLLAGLNFTLSHVAFADEFICTC